ncbi:MAG: ABC transporter permease [Bdellovibrionaceae bacterium]|nr:ABC transporter permease [Pseudobdellovibrionaceae bacterium]
MTPLKLAYLSLTRHRFSTIITVLALGLSISCAGILLRLYLLSESRFSAMGKAGDAIVGAKAGGIEIMLGSLNGEGKYPDFLPYKLFESLRSDQNVKFEDGQSLQPHYIKSIIPFLYFGKYKGFRVVGTDDSFLHRPTTADTLTLKEGRWFKAANDIVVGATFAKSEQLHIGDRIKVNPWIGESILSNEFEFEVSGILQATETRWDYMGFANFVEAQRILGEYPAILSRYSIWGSQVLNYFLVYVNNGGFEKLEALINKRTVGQSD